MVPTVFAILAQVSNRFPIEEEPHGFPAVTRVRSGRKEALFDEVMVFGYAILDMGTLIDIGRGVVPLISAISLIWVRRGRENDRDATDNETMSFGFGSDSDNGHDGYSNEKSRKERGIHQ